MTLDVLHRWLNTAWISPEVTALQPDYRALLFAADDLQPGASDSHSEKVLAAAEDSARNKLRDTPLEEIPQVQQWRDAFKAFGAKPSRTRPSVEGLLRRLDPGLPRIDRLTDTYNAVSIRHLLPVGGEDLRQYAGPLRLTRANGHERFDTIACGDLRVEHPAPGEVVWRDDDGVTCRRWNWRQCTRTRITDQTTRGLFILDGLSALGPTGLQEAGEHLRRLLLDTNPQARIASRLLTAE